MQTEYDLSQRENDRNNESFSDEIHDIFISIIRFHLSNNQTTNTS